MDWNDMARYKDMKPALMRETMNLLVLKMREFLDSLRAFEFFKDSVRFSLEMRGAILPSSHMPPRSAQIIFHLLNLTSHSSFSLLQPEHIKSGDLCQIFEFVPRTFFRKIRDVYYRLTELSIL